MSSHHATRRRPLRIALALLVSLPVCLACGDEPSRQEIRALQNRGNFAASVEPLRRALEEHPRDAELHFLYGFALLQLGRASLALWPLREASEDPEFRVPASMALARAALAARDYRAAIDSTNAVLELQPDQIHALRLRGQARLGDHIDAEGARSDLARALELDPGDMPTRLSHLTALLALERVDEAGEAFEEIERRAAEGVLLEDEVARICTLGASFADERGESERALALYDACLEAHPESAAVLDAAIDFFGARGDEARVHELLRDFVERTRSTTHRGRLVRRLRQRGEGEEAKRLLLEVTRSDSPLERAHAYSALTDLYIESGELSEAVEAFEAAIEHAGPLSERRRLAYADLLVGAGMNERAQAVAAELEEPTLRELIRARLALNRGQPCEGLEIFEGAFARWPNNAVARYYAARAAEQCGKFERAFEHYWQSLRSGAEATDAGLRLGRMLLAEGRAEDALFGLQQHLTAHPGDSEATLLRIRGALQSGRADVVEDVLRSVPPSRLRARVVTALAEHAASQRGADFALAGLRAIAGVDLSHPRDAPALELRVRLLAQAGRLDEARDALDAALSAHPDAADLQRVRARLLELEGAPASAVGDALERALELDPEHAEALQALARHEAAQGASADALALYERAARVDPSDPAPTRSAALLLEVLGRAAEAEQRLEALLVEFPHDADSALALASLRGARGAPLAPTLALARRAAHFGGGEEAEALLARLTAEGDAERSRPSQAD